MITGSSGAGPVSPVPEARLREWVAEHGAPRAEDAARARSLAVGQQPERMTKQSLVAISHAIERAALAAAPDEPSVLLALFQRIEHFDRERAVYRQLADAGIRVVVGFCDEPHDVPDGVEVVRLDPAEALVDEWSVIGLSASAGAFLVATDQHEFDRRVRSREAGREFLARWGFSHVQTGVELARIRLAVGSRLSGATLGFIDRTLSAVMPTGGGVAGSGGTRQELWSTTAAFHLAERMNRARAGSARLRAQLADAHAAVAARAAAAVDPQSGLTMPEFLQRWSAPGGSTALPIGLAVFDLDAVSRATDDRAAYHLARKVAAALTQPLGPVDAAVRLTERSFLIVVPGASEMHLARICDDVLDQLRLASDGYPHVPLEGGVATVVTRQRPLPLSDLRQSLDRLAELDGPGPVDAGTTVIGDRITVCRTEHRTEHRTEPRPGPRPRPVPDAATPVSRAPSRVLLDRPVRLHPDQDPTT